MDDIDRQLLKLATTPYKHRAIRAETVLTDLGYSEPAMWARVAWLIERSEVEREMPTAVRRLRRLRDARAAARGRFPSHIGVNTGVTGWHKP